MEIKRRYINQTKPIDKNGKIAALTKNKATKLYLFNTRENPKFPY